MTETTNGSASGTGRQVPVRETHRQYSLDLKRRIVEETFVPGASVSIVARQHNVNSNLVFTWRRRYREGTLGPSNARSKATRTSAQDLIRIGVIEPGSGLRPLRVADSSSSLSPQPPCCKEPVTHETDSSGAAGIIEIELPNRVKLRVAVGVEEAALRKVLAVTRQLP
jgi:transposase-like protein